jgi:uncharacterized protein
MKKKFPPKLKIVLSAVFVVAVAFFVARAFWPEPADVRKPAKKVVLKKKKPALPVKKKAAPKKAPVAAAPPAGSSRMAIILDDWGMNASLVEDAVAIRRPLTLAVLPHLLHSREIAEEAHANGLSVMLHMPMQPKSLRSSEAHAIRTNTPDDDIRYFLDKALAGVPHVQGVNNHQGSAATSDLRVMRTVLSHLKKKGYFFVDSKVIATSAADEAAEETGIRFASRDVFIDNEPAVEAVKAKLREAIELAQRKGSVVVIGHDKRSTLEAIRQMVPEIEKNGVKLVHAKELVK